MNNWLKKLKDCEVLCVDLIGDEDKIIAQRFDDSGSIVEDRQESYSRSSFGGKVTLAENFMAVGVQDLNDSRGAVYVYQKNTNDKKWYLDAKLEAKDGEEDDYFGFNVAMTANMLVVGADGDEHSECPDNKYCVGSVYVYLRNAEGKWVLSQKLIASGDKDFNFGEEVAISDSVIVVGNHEDDATVFEHDGDTWTAVKRIAYGTLGVSKNVIVSLSKYVGVATIYTRSSVSDEWEMTQEVDLGFETDSVSILENSIAFGITNDIDKKTGQKGAVHIFTKGNGGIWEKTQKLQTRADGTRADAYLGRSVAMTENMLVVSKSKKSKSESSYGNNGAYMFSRTEDGTWTEAKKAVAGDGETYVESVSAFGTNAIIGVPHYDDYKGSVFTTDLNCAEE